MDDSERQGLVSSDDGRKKTPDWSRFGLSKEQQNETLRQVEEVEGDSYHHHHDPSDENELFAQDQSSRNRPWWQSNFFISEPVLFGTWDGVFTSCMINIFGVVIFLRTGWMVGNAGIGFSILIILMTISVATIAALSAIGVCERCKMERGGVYFLLSHVLGAKVGASIGILYCFGQAVACSLYVVGFGESISSLIHQDNPWVSRGIAMAVIVLLLGINVAGVKWVIRVQLVLLIVLFVAVLDFLVGSFVHTDRADGFLGYNSVTLSNNTAADYQEGETFFTVFGVFFPTATGVFAGINMSGDLQNPAKNIPVGTMSAVGVSTFLYLAFGVVLGATCTRDVLQNDYMIAEKVSIVGFLFLAGLYISSISSCMGGLYGSPRILQTISTDEVIPLIRVLGQGVSIAKLWLLGFYMCTLSCALGSSSSSPRLLNCIGQDKITPHLEVLKIERGPNKVPVFALIVIACISLVFILFGNVNTLGPIVTMPFMLTYAAVDYAYFSLAMSFDKRKAREDRYSPSHTAKMYPAAFDHTSLQGPGQSDQHVYGSIDRKKVGSGNDLDKLFPERRQHDQPQHQPLGSPTFVTEDPTSPGPVPSSERVITDTPIQEVDQSQNLLTGKQAHPANTTITSQPRSFYSIFCNRWLSLFGAVISIIVMFGIQWGYALCNFLAFLMIYIYIGQFNPGVFPGIAEFSMYEWIREGFYRCCRRGPPPAEQIVVTPNTPAMNTMAAQLTEDNEDFAERGRYHQSEIVKGENFDDYQD